MHHIVIAKTKNIIALLILSLFVLKGITINVLHFSLHTPMELTAETPPAESGEESTEQKLLEKEFLPDYDVTCIRQPHVYIVGKIWNPHYHDYLLISFLPVFTPPPENA